jgi:hypothetical protein
VVKAVVACMFVFLGAEGVRWGREFVRRLVTRCVCWLMMLLVLEDLCGTTGYMVDEVDAKRIDKGDKESSRLVLFYAMHIQGWRSTSPLLGQRRPCSNVMGIMERTFRREARGARVRRGRERLSR